jgi:hypothetical protein
MHVAVSMIRRRERMLWPCYCVPKCIYSVCQCLVLLIGNTFVKLAAALKEEEEVSHHHTTKRNGQNQFHKWHMFLFLIVLHLYGMKYLLCFTNTLSCTGARITRWYSTGLRPGRSGVLVLAGAGNFSLHHCVQTGSGAHPSSCPMGIRGSCPVGKVAGALSSLTSI